MENTTGLTMDSGPCRLSVLIPSLNEAPNLYRLLPVLREALNAMEISWEILVIDADSKDGSRKVAEDNPGVRYILEEKRGYGVALQRGAAEARGEYLLTMDADLSHPSKFIQELWKRREEADILIASRYVAGGHAEQPLFRLLLSRILNAFFSKGLDVGVKDMSSGFRLYRRAALESLQLEFTNFVILVEILLKAFAKGMRIEEVPFHYKPRTSGSSKARILQFGMDYLRLFHRTWRIRNSVDFPDYDWRAYSSRIPLQRYWQRKRHEIVLRFTPPMVPTCDVGCGSSRILADLPHAIGVDVRHDKLAFMRRTNTRLVQASGLTLPFPDAAFDVVICSQVIEHIPEENGRLLDELARILEPGGVLIIGTPDYSRWEWRAMEWLYAKAAPSAYADEHVTHYTFDSLAKALGQRGFALEEHAYIGRGELIIRARKQALPGESAV